jgi:nucleotide-binding universal stress UspA family protein
MNASLPNRHDPADGTVLVAYDGSDPAKAAIRELGRELRPGQTVLVLTVLATPLSGVVLLPSSPWEAGSLAEVAWKVAEEGAELTRAEGLEAKPVVVYDAPTWKQIVKTADEHDAGLIVLGSRGRSGAGHAPVGGVAGAVARRTDRPVLIIHEDRPAEDVGEAA